MKEKTRHAIMIGIMVIVMTLATIFLYLAVKSSLGVEQYNCVNIPNKVVADAEDLFGDNYYICNIETGGCVIFRGEVNGG